METLGRQTTGLTAYLLVVLGVCTNARLFLDPTWDYLLLDPTASGSKHTNMFPFCFHSVFHSVFVVCPDPAKQESVTAETGFEQRLAVATVLLARGVAEPTTGG